MQVKRAKFDEFCGRLFAIHRDLLGDFEPSPAFSAKVWARIEARRRAGAEDMDFWTACLTEWSRWFVRVAMVAAALALWLPFANDAGPGVLETSYVDVLIQDELDQ